MKQRRAAAVSTQDVAAYLEAAESASTVRPTAPVIVTPATLKETLETGSSVTWLYTDQEPSDRWPENPKTVMRAVEGILADRVRARFGAAEDQDVFIEEETEYGGYSEWTQENNTTFTVICGTHSVHFEAESSEDEWSSIGENDSVFAKFQFWLSAAENTEENWKQFFTPGRVPGHQEERLVVRKESILSRLVLGQYHNSRPGNQASLAKLSDGNWGLSIRVRYHRPEATTTYFSTRVPSASDIDDPATQKAILMSLADRYCATRL